MGRSSKSVGSILIILLLMAVAVGTDLSAANAAPDGTVDDIRLTSARDFLFAYQPQSPGEDSVLITAQLFKGGQPVKQAGIPVNFSLSDGRFATLDDTRVYTDRWGMASTRVRSFNSGRAMSERPFLLAITASSGDKSTRLTMPITHYISLSGTVKDKNGTPVDGAHVGVLYNRTRQPISAMGATSATDIRGKYRLERVPTDLGGMVVYARKGDLETYTPASIPA
jgi:hypothetical protein